MTSVPRHPPPRPGLSPQAAARLLAEHGPNVLTRARRVGPLRRLAANLVHLFALLLWTGAALAAVGGLPELSAAIVVVVLVNAAFATVQEHRAERAVDALGRMLPPRARVRRGGHAVEVPGEEVVPGDVLLLAAGDRVAADAALTAAAGLRLDESSLTGESVPVERAAGDGVSAGTFVTSGSGEATVTATGMGTRFGRIAGLTQATRRRRSPLEHELDRVTRLVAAVSVGIGVAFFLLAGAMGMPLDDRFVFAIGVTVANVPEGLLPTVTLSLALATQRMARRSALVRRLSSVETLGETTVICTDKTGTLTENQMTVVRAWTPDGDLTVEGAGYAPFGRILAEGAVVPPDALRELARAGLLCGDSRLLHGPDGYTVTGDPTEGALVVLGEKAGLRQEQEAALRPRLAEAPFTSERRRMTTVHLDGASRVAYVKGAAEAVLPLTTAPPAVAEAARAAAARMEGDALRVLCLARRAGAPDDPWRAEEGLELLGLVGIEDPPRPGVPDALRRCRDAGIRVVMVTGDSPRTAVAVGREIGLFDREPHVITGPEVAAADDAELAARLAEPLVVFARTDPEQKLRIARVLRAAGEVVAMTGDGVNDAPALKEADIGVAMGRGGTEVAREAADMVLLDDDFSSVVAAVEEGRAVYDNIRRFTAYHFCSNVGELVPFLVWGVTLGAVPLPLVVMQVLAIDLGTDMLPAIALGAERAEPGVMARPPRPRGERLLNRRVLARVYGWVGLFVALSGMAGFLFAFGLEGWRPWDPLPDEGRVYVTATAMTFAGIVMGQVGAAFAMRTSRAPTWSVGVLSNRLLLAGVAFEVAFLAALVYVPPLREVFHTEPLGPWHWLWLSAWPFVVVAAEEARKAVVRARGDAGGRPHPHGSEPRPRPRPSSPNGPTERT